MHILDQTAQTEVHAENQLPRYPRSGLKVPVGGGGGGGGWWYTKYSDQHRPRVELNNIFLHISSSYANILGETNFQPQKIPEVGQKQL